MLFTLAGIYTPNEELAKEVIAASEKSGEKLWRMPLEDSYWEMMKSGVADMVNTGGRAGGSITAALFLKQVKTNSLLNFISINIFLITKPFLYCCGFSVCEREGAMDAHRHGWTGLEREEEVWDWVWCCHAC